MQCFRRRATIGFIAIAVAATGLGGVFPALASAASSGCPSASYAPSGCVLSGSSSSVVAGNTLTVAGTGFASASRVALSLGSTSLTTVTTSSSGSFSQVVTIPANTPAGAATLTATGTNSLGSSLSETFSLTVSAATAPPPSTVPASDLGAPSTVQTSSTVSVTDSATVGGATASVTVAAGALPAGTTFSIYPVTNVSAYTTALASILASSSSGVTGSYVVSFAVSWIAPNGTSPTATAPIALTITDPTIKAGDKVYEVTNIALRLVGTARTNGSITLTFTADPVFLVLSSPQLAIARRAGTATVSTVHVKLSCRAGKLCKGTANLNVARRVVRARRRVTVQLIVAKATYSFAKGTSEFVTFHVTRAGKGVLARRFHYKEFRMGLVSFLTGGVRTVGSIYVP